MVLRYLPGLNGLRCIAALIVVLHHIYQSTVKLGLLQPIVATVFFDRGRAAVDFFFTLSGFLITYLLLQELQKTHTVSLKRFYLRRILRIWPLYYIVLILGFLIFTGIYPRVYHKPYFEFNLLTGIVLYVLFLPHWMAAYYKVGLLLPLWSIGVEEQFYLMWAPLVKWLGRRGMGLLIAGFAIVTAISYSIFCSGYFGNEHIDAFLAQLRFHYMAAGSIFAYLLFYYGEGYKLSVMSGRPFQLCVIGIITYHYLIGWPVKWGVGLDILLGVCYGLLILSVSVLDNPVLKLETRPLVYLGKISYGIYMYHMLADYAVRTAFGILNVAGSGNPIWPLLYGAAVIAGTIATAHLSYRFIESYFLSLGATHTLAPIETVSGS